MTWGAVIAGTVAVAGQVVSSQGAKKAGESAGRSGKVLRGFDIATAQRRERVAARLEAIANKLLNDEPISGQERQLLDTARDVATKGIKQARTEAQEGALGAQAATGFLKSGRTAEQLRRINIEGGEAQQRVELAREQATSNAIRQRQQTAFGLLSASAGIQPVQFQQFQQPLQSQSILGAGLSGLGGALMQRQAQQSALASQQRFGAANVNRAQQATLTSPSSLQQSQFPAGAFGSNN